MKNRIKQDLQALMLVPGLSGYEERVAGYLKKQLHALGLSTRSDRLGNLLVQFPGSGPKVMLFTHMDQLGFLVRKIEADGFLRVERLGGVPERALAGQPVLVCVGEGRDVAGVFANKSHHATLPEEKYKVLPYSEMYIDLGFSSAADVRAAGINIGSPVVYFPKTQALNADRVAGTSIDDRAGCAVLLEVARHLAERTAGPPVDIVFTVQEEFNLRGALPMAQQLCPDIAIQLDLILATDTPDMQGRGDVALGAGPAMSMFSFHGRGTLNGVIPHPSLVALFDRVAQDLSLPLQRSAHIGALTDLSYVQLVGEGVAALDLGFPMRYSHSPSELCDLNDLAGLSRLLIAGLQRIDPAFSLLRGE